MTPHKKRYKAWLVFTNGTSLSKLIIKKTEKDSYGAFRTHWFEFIYLKQSLFPVTFSIDCMPFVIIQYKSCLHCNGLYTITCTKPEWHRCRRWNQTNMKDLIRSFISSNILRHLMAHVYDLTLHRIIENNVPPSSKTESYGKQKLLH